MEKVTLLAFKAMSRSIALEIHYRKEMAKLTGKTEEEIKIEIDVIQNQVNEDFEKQNKS